MPNSKPFAPCEEDSECPAGYVCKGEFEQRYCADSDYACWNNNHCKNDTGAVNISSSTRKACVPQAFTLEFSDAAREGWCDCDSDADCSGVSYAGVSAPKCTFNNFSVKGNRCQPGTLATPCQDNSDCNSGLKCMTNGLNVCGQGAVGEGAGNIDECSTHNIWQYTCVPNGFVAPEPEYDIPAG